MSRRFIVLCLTPSFIAGLFLLSLYDPAAYSLFPRCPFRVLTGLKCPGCGTLRAIHAALNGRWDEAIALNPILVIAVPLMAVLLMFPKVARNKYVGYGVLVVVVLYWIVRNLV